MFIQTPLEQAIRRKKFFSQFRWHPLHGWYFKGRGRQPAPALVVQFHGNAENLSTHFANLIWLVDEGYDLFVFDYRGYGRSQGQPKPEGTIHDGLGALEWAHERAGVRPLIVYGQSLGGAVALRSVEEWKDRSAIRLLVAESTFLSYRSVGRSILKKKLAHVAFSMDVLPCSE